MYVTAPESPCPRAFKYNGRVGVELTQHSHFLRKRHELMAQSVAESERFLSEKRVSVLEEHSCQWEAKGSRRRCMD